MNAKNTDQTADKNISQQRFSLFFVSSALLLASLCGLSYAEFFMEKSLEQEILGFASLSIGALSGLGAILGYVGILWLRLSKFFNNEGRQ